MYTFFTLPSGLCLLNSTRVRTLIVSFTHPSHSPCRGTGITTRCVVTLHTAVNSKFQSAGSQKEKSPRATLPRPQRPKPLLPTVGDCILRVQNRAVSQGSKGDLREGIVQDHFCQGIITGRKTQKFREREKASGEHPSLFRAFIAPLVPNVISEILLSFFPACCCPHPHPPVDLGSTQVGQPHSRQCLALRAAQL